MSTKVMKLLRLLILVATVSVPVWLLVGRVWFKHSEGYRAAVEDLRRQPRLQEIVGDPIKLQLGLLAGYYEVGWDGGHRSVMDFSVSGPKSSGKAEVHLVRRESGWVIQHIFFVERGSDHEIAIVKDGKIVESAK